MSFLNKVKQHLLPDSEDVLNVLDILTLKHNLEKLRKEERDAAARIGYEVLARGEAEKYGSNGEELLEIIDRISVLEGQLADEKKHLIIK